MLLLDVLKSYLLQEIGSILAEEMNRGLKLSWLDISLALKVKGNSICA